MTQFLTLVNGQRQLTDVSAADLPDLGVGLSSQQIFYGSSTPGVTVNENVTIPPWAISYRLRYQGAGAGAMGGAHQPTATTAINGGASGAGGFYLDIQGGAADLRALGGTVIALALGAPGAGGLGRNAAGSGNNGTAGADSTAAVNGVIFARAAGGNNTTSFSSAASNANKFGGEAGVNGVVGSNGAGANGLVQNTLNSAAGGGAGAGIAASGPFLSGGLGARGGVVNRNAIEAVAAAGNTAGANGGNAVAVLVGDVPQPGNSGGGGASNPTGNGGNGGAGINGGGGGGGGAARTGTSGAGGPGGNAFAVIEFFGSVANPVQLTVISPPIAFGGRLTLSAADPLEFGANNSLVYYLPHLSAYHPAIDGTTEQVSLRQIPNSGLVLSMGGRSVGVYDIFIRYDSGLQQSVLGFSLWSNTTTRGYSLGRVAGLLVASTANATTKESLYLGTIYWSGSTVSDINVRRGVWNYYNQVLKPVQVFEAAASWTYAGGAWRPYNNSTANRIEVVTGLPQTLPINMQSRVSQFGAVSLSLDSTTAPIRFVTFNAAGEADVDTDVKLIIPVGFHYSQALEISLTGTVTLKGEGQGGLTGEWLC